MYNRAINCIETETTKMSDHSPENAASPGPRPKSVFSIDVEDWFHINGAPSEPACADWANYPSHVSRNFRALLEMLAAKRVRATCFFLGWVAEKYPELVREARDQGHEIASHGYAHRLVHRQTPSEFLDDIRKARAILEDVSGMPVVGYRAPSFSVTAATRSSATRCAPAEKPCTTLSTPGGRPASMNAAARRSPMSGVIGDGLNTTV